MLGQWKYKAQARPQHTTVASINNFRIDIALRLVLNFRATHLEEMGVWLYVYETGNLVCELIAYGVL